MQKQGEASEPKRELIFCFHDYMGSDNLILDHNLLIEHTKQTE